MLCRSLIFSPQIVPSNEESSALDLSALVGDLGADENLVAA